MISSLFPAFDAFFWGSFFPASFSFFSVPKDEVICHHIDDRDHGSRRNQKIHAQAYANAQCGQKKDRCCGGDPMHTAAGRFPDDARANETDAA